MFDYDDSLNLAFDAKIAGKSLVAAKHELLTKTGDFLFLAHSDRELALRMQMVEEDIEKVAYRKLSNISDSKAKLVRTVFDEWKLRHASCEMCKTANLDGVYDGPVPSGNKMEPTRYVSGRQPERMDHETGKGMWFSHIICTTDSTGFNYVKKEPCSGEGCEHCAEVALK